MYLLLVFYGAHVFDVGLVKNPQYAFTRASYRSFKKDVPLIFNLMIRDILYIAYFTANVLMSSHFFLYAKAVILSVFV